MMTCILVIVLDFGTVFVGGKAFLIEWDSSLDCGCDSMCDTTNYTLRELFK